MRVGRNRSESSIVPSEAQSSHTIHYKEGVIGPVKREK